MPRRLVVLLVLLALALLFALLDTAGSMLRSGLRGSGNTWGWTFSRTVPVWLLFALLTPAVLWLSRRFRIEARNAWRTVPLHVVAAALFPVVHLALLHLQFRLRFGLPPGATSGKSILDLLGAYFVVEFFIYVAIAAAAHGWHYFRAAEQRAAAEARLAESLARARLDALSARLQPHFLFNTLNAISTLALRGDGPTVARTIGHLSELLRASFDDTLAQQVPLATELGLLDRYLEIQRLRFGDRLVIERRIEAEALDVAVPSLLLLPLVENAVQHGVGARTGSGRIEIGARREGARLVLSVADDGPGPGAAGAGGHGVGLAGTRARLEQLHGAAASLALAARPGGGAEVSVSLPWRTADVAAAT